MADTDLSKVLSECCEAARSGYELASGEKDVLDGILTSAEEKIRETAVEYKVSPCEIVGIGETLEGQLSEIQGSIDDLRMSFSEDLDALERDLEKFSIDYQRYQKLRVERTCRDGRAGYRCFRGRGRYKARI